MCYSVVAFFSLSFCAIGHLLHMRKKTKIKIELENR